MIIICVQSDLLWFYEYSIFLRCKLIYFICQLGHMIRMQHSDWFVMCYCLHYLYDGGNILLLIIRFCACILTNSCQLFITNCAHTFKWQFSDMTWEILVKYLTIGFWDFSLRICVVYLFFYSGEKSRKWKPIGLLWCFAAKLRAHT